MAAFAPVYTFQVFILPILRKNARVSLLAQDL
jgi:hypothetical protein